MRLEGERVDCARVDGLDGGELLLVIVHEIREAAEEGSAVARVHPAPLALLEGALGGVDGAVNVLKRETTSQQIHCASTEKLYIDICILQDIV